LQFLILLSLFIGFGIKAEIFPLNFWVADIYQATSPKIASLFSAIVSKSFIFVFFNILYTLNIDPKYQSIFVVLGIISFLIAEISAFTSRDIQRVFAYSTLGQLGVVFFAFSYGNLTILAGGIFLIFLHSLTKLMLFLSLDILNNKFNSTKIDIFKQFDSLFLTIIFSIGFLSLLGIPPFGGFIAKLTILVGLGSLKEYFIIAGILVISLIEAIYLFRIIGLTRSSGDKVKLEISFSQKAVLGLIALIIIYTGLYPEMLLNISQEVARTILGVRGV
jgi:formate hydrogenlyase subunit 3/multisubunit Na+/H+ antiporter MnhD subunit